MALNFQNSDATPLRRVLLVLLLVVSLVMVTVYAREGADGPLHAVQNAVAAAVAPLKFVGTSAAAGADAAGESLGNATADESTLSGLRQRNAELTEQLAQDEELRQENERLRGLLDLKGTYDLDGVAARVVGRSSNAYSQTVTIDVGENDGVDTGLTVMGSTGVVGQVIATTGSTATVRLLTDPGSGAGAIIQSSRAEGVVRGSLDGLLYLEAVDADVVVNVDDLVVTSGLGGSYTRGLLIGRVVKVEGSPGDATRRIVVSPNGTAGALEEVFVVKSPVADDAQGGDQ